MLLTGSWSHLVSCLLKKKKNADGGGGGHVPPVPPFDSATALSPAQNS